MYVKDETTNIIIIEKSKFITYLKHINDEEAYKNYLKEIKKKYYDATHVCSALIIEGIRRSNDDGEPSGTAGAPILNSLIKNKINNTCAIVIRYFGGIKLGAGGLIRAYGNSVNEALKKATLVEDISYNKYQIILSYELANRIKPIILKNNLFLNIEYDDKVTFTYVPKEETINNKIIEITKGIIPICIGKQIIQKVIK